MKKSLPVITAPTLTVELPVSLKKIKYRPFIVKEQKALMLAQESKDPVMISDTVKSVISACTFGDLDVDTIPAGDLAYFFVQLRIQSVGAEVKFSIACESCDQDVIINFDLDQLKVDVSNYKDIVMISDDVGMTFRVPSLKDSEGFDPKSIDSTIALLHRIMVNVFDSDQVYEKSDYTLDEFKGWLETFTDDQLNNIYDWVNTIPELRHELKFVCNHCKAENCRPLEGLHSFFRFGDDT